MRLFRSAITGRFVSSLFARLHPTTTVSEPSPYMRCPSCHRLIRRDADVCFWCQAQKNPTDGTFNVSSDTAPCQFCRKEIAVEAVVCPWCQSQLRELK